MFKHLLVPLDGSPMSEAAAATAAYLAVRDGAEVTLLHVLEESTSPTVHGQFHLTEYQQAVDYLEGIRHQFFPETLNVGCHVHRRPVKNVGLDLARHAGIMKPDLIILCAHGHRRLRDRILGSIAQTIVKAVSIPVLMLQTSNAVPGPFQKMLILLDGQPKHESSLIPAASLAKICGTEIVLMNVIETAGKTLRAEGAVSASMLPSTAMELADLDEQNAKSYLQTHIQKMRETGLAVSGCIDRGAAIDRIVDYVNSRGVDIVALSTHGKAGTRAFWAGVLAPKLIRRFHRVSFLLVPASV